MWVGLFVIISLLLNVCPLRGQSTLTFARVMQSGDLTATGFAIVNDGSAPAVVGFTLRDAAGNTISSTSATVPAGGQLARLASELFPNAQTGGWVQASSTASNLHGFWVTAN